MPYQKIRIGLLDLPDELISHIFVLVYLAPPFLSYRWSAIDQVQPPPIETRTPHPNTLYALYSLSERLRSIAFHTPHLAATSVLRIMLDLYSGQSEGFASTLYGESGPFLSCVASIRSNLRHAGSVLPLRLVVDATFPCPHKYLDGTRLEHGGSRYNVVGTWLKGKIRIESQLFLGKLVGKERLRERWEVLDLTMPDYTSFDSLLGNLLTVFPNLKKLVLINTFPDPDRAPPGLPVANSFLHNLKLKFPRLENLILNLKIALVPSPLFRPPQSSSTSSVTPIALYGYVEDQRWEILDRYPTDSEVLRINDAAREALSHHSSTFHSSSPLEYTTTLSCFAQMMWPALRRLTLDMYTSGVQMVYLVSHLPGLEMLDIHLSGDAYPNPESNASNAESNTQRINLTKLKTLVIRSASLAGLGMLNYVAAFKLEGFHIHMDIVSEEITSASWTYNHEEDVSRILTGFILSCSPTFGDGSSDSKLGSSGENQHTLTLKYLKLVSLPLSDTSVFRLLSCTPGLEELRMWWVGPRFASMSVAQRERIWKMDAGVQRQGWWVNGLLPRSPAEGGTIVPLLRQLEVHVLPPVLLGERVRTEYHDGKDEDKMDVDPEDTDLACKSNDARCEPEIAHRLLSLVQARFHSGFNPTLYAKLTVRAKPEPCAGCGGDYLESVDGNTEGGSIGIGDDALTASGVHEHGPQSRMVGEWEKAGSDVGDFSVY